MANNYCGAHLKKYKNIFSMIKVQAHNLRNKKEVELGNNIDEDLLHLNNIFKYNGFEDIEKTYYKCLKKCKRKPRKDHIMCLDYVFYRSDCFETEEEKNAFRDCSLEFFEKYFKDCPFIVYEHNDEGVQHFHVMVIPFNEKEFKFVGSNFCGKRQDLIKLQDLYADYCAFCNLERGKAKSKDKHKDIGKYYEEEAQKLQEQYKNDLLEMEQNYNDIYDEVDNKLKHIQNINKTLDDEIAQKKDEAQIENLEKYKEGVITYYKELENTLKQDDGSEYFQGVRACFEYLKNLLISMGLLHRNKEHEQER